MWIALGLLGLIGVALLLGIGPSPVGPREATSDGDSFAIPASLNGWSRLDEATLAFKGPIREGSFEQMRTKLDDRVDTLVITSRGGRVASGVRMGKLVLEQNLDVVVERYCLSSCANYVFLAGAQKTIRDGVVGFHGNITHSIRQAGGPEARAEQMADRSPRSKEDLVSWLRKRIEMEQSLIRRIGVPQAFYAMTASVLAERNRASDAAYDFLLPRQETFAEYGMTDIQSQQSETWKRRTERQLGVRMLLY